MAKRFCSRLIGSSKKIQAHRCQLRIPCTWKDDTWIAFPKESVKSNNVHMNIQSKARNLSNQIPQSCLVTRTGDDIISAKYDACADQQNQCSKRMKKRSNVYSTPLVSGSYKKKRTMNESVSGPKLEACIACNRSKYKHVGFNSSPAAYVQADGAGHLNCLWQFSMFGKRKYYERFSQSVSVMRLPILVVFDASSIERSLLFDLRNRFEDQWRAMLRIQQHRHHRGVRIIGRQTNFKPAEHSGERQLRLDDGESRPTHVRSPRPHGMNALGCRAARLKPWENRAGSNRWASAPHNDSSW
ncbi:hypothetical protein HPP92_022899 [Vanilla planifolia]|uniref:Uncharacterized protein n=1 Tax=Vanilla planifolia TaxID=51239 RepID=A0A835PT00_VANPL|nr:hypothetical protein HPP92_022899 [Vanilla planifolia]